MNVNRSMQTIFHKMNGYTIGRQSLIRWMATDVSKQSVIKWMLTEVCKQSLIKWMVTQLADNLW